VLPQTIAHTGRHEAALRYFSPVYVRYGSFATNHRGPAALDVRFAPKADK